MMSRKFWDFWSSYLNTFYLSASYLKAIVLTGVISVLSACGPELNNAGSEFTKADNPFSAIPKNEWYVNPIWSGKAIAQPNGVKIAGEPTAVLVETINSIDAGDHGLRYHLDQALTQNAKLFTFVFYDLLDKHCSARSEARAILMHTSELRNYKEQYVEPIIKILSEPKYAGLHIVTILRLEALPKVITSVEPDCEEAAHPTGLLNTTAYIINQLNTVPNTYVYLDIANAGTFGWADNLAAASKFIVDAVKQTELGVNSIAGFASNIAAYIPLTEPFIPAPSTLLGETPIRSADFYGWNPHFGELSYVKVWREAMLANGFPEHIGMVIDTGRNGWGGPKRPQSASTSTDLNMLVDSSRVDRRQHRTNWCNQPSGIGERPKANPASGIHAYLWIWPQGLSDGVSTADFDLDPNLPTRAFNSMCGPNKLNDIFSTIEQEYGTGALPNAPHAYSWFPEGFDILLENAYPAL